MKIEKEMMVSIDYKLTNDAGELLDTSDGRGPLMYIHGTGEIIPGLEEELDGKSVSDKFVIVVPPAKAYGERSDDMLISIPKERLGEDHNFKAGDVVELHDERQGAIPAKIVEFKDDLVVLDGNHPLAGENLTFDVTVTEVRAASKEELDALNGPAGSGCGCSGGSCGTSDDSTDGCEDNGGCNSGGCCC